MSIIELPELPNPIPFVQASKYKSLEVGSHNRSFTLIVLHTMECPSMPGKAMWCARYFAAGSDGRDASAHYCIDNGVIVHCVQEKDVAYGAPNANQRGIHIEHAGTSDQTAAQWKSVYNTAMLKLSAVMVADIAKRRGIPLTFLTSADIQDGKHGITTHRNVSAAYHTPGGHTDPGPDFPIHQYMEWVKEASLRQG